MKLNIIPKELKPIKLCIEPACANPNCSKPSEESAKKEDLNPCTRCETVHFCGDHCQEAFGPTHQVSCQAIERLRSNLAESQHDISQVASVMSLVPDEALLQDGLLGKDFLTRRYVADRWALALALFWKACETEAAPVWEEVLSHLVALKQQTYRWSPSCWVDLPLLLVLLKLYRDDEAASLFIHWTHQANHKKPLWPLPVQDLEGFRFKDVHAILEKNLSRMQYWGHIREQSSPNASLFTGSCIRGDDLELVDAMLLPMLILKTRVLVVLERQIEASGYCRKNRSMEQEHALQTNYQEQLECIQGILDHFASKNSGCVLKKLLRRFRVQQSGIELNETSETIGLLAVLFGGEESVVETLVDLIRMTLEESMDDNKENHAPKIGVDPYTSTSTIRKQKYVLPGEEQVAANASPNLREAHVAKVLA